jgi:hypothetical protein
MPLDTKLLGSDLFDSLSGEDKQEIRKFEVRNINKAIDEMIEGFLSVEFKDSTGRSNPYPSCELNIPKKYTARDIEEFSIVLGNFQDVNHFSRKAGEYLSALIKNSRAKNFTIHTNHLHDNLHNLCYWINGKRVLIKGNEGFKSMSDLVEAMLKKWKGKK